MSDGNGDASLDTHNDWDQGSFDKVTHHCPKAGRAIVVERGRYVTSNLES